MANQYGPDLGNALMAAAQIRGAQQREQMNALAMQDAMTQRQTRNAFAAAAPNLINPANRQNALTALAAQAPEALPDAASIISKFDALDDASRERVGKMTTIIAQTMGALEPIDDARLPEIASAASAHLKSQGINTDQFDRAVQTGDPKAIRQVVQFNVEMGRTLQERQTQKNADRTFTAQQENTKATRDLTEQQRTETNRHNQVMEGAAQTRAANTGKTGDRQDRRDKIALRKEFDALPDVKDYNAIANSADVTAQLGKTKSAADDMALIFTFMKALDPQSVVREGEFANAQNTTGIPGAITNAYNRALSGNRLNDQQRTEFAQTVKTVLGARKKNYDARVLQYRKYAVESGLPEDTIQERATGAAPEAVPAATTATAPMRARNAAGQTLEWNGSQWVEAR